MRQVGLVLLLLCGWTEVAFAQQRPIAAADLRSGVEFASPEVRDLQKDDFANPGMLWVERGAKLWNEAPREGAKSCAGCHGDAATSMRGVAARYPKLGPRIETKGAKTGLTGRARELRNVEAQVNACRRERQGETAWRWESEELLSVTAFVAHQSRQMRINTDITGDARPHFEAGRRLYSQRMGQMNLACANCHDANWGKTLHAERISQGHPTAFPAYRMEWQNVGSLERRLRACLSGIRAEMYPYGAKELRQLSLYLSWRAQGLPIETPGVRR